MPIPLRTHATGRRRREFAPRAVELLAFRQLVERGFDRAEIQETLKISRATYYRFRAALAELGEHNQESPDAGQEG
jgi:hypothetical protein